MDTLITKLYKSSKTVLTSRDLALIWKEKNKKKLRYKIDYYKKRGILIGLTKGIYSKDKNYNPKELATSIYIPSYISFETVLREAGMIFQHYDRMFVASKYSNTVTIDKTIITFKKLKDIVLFNSTGIINKENYSIATKERAFLDTIYISPNYYFDNLRFLDWEKCEEIVKIYNNKQLIKRMRKYKEDYVQ